MKKTILFFLGSIFIASCSSTSHNKLAKAPRHTQRIYTPEPTISNTSPSKNEVNYESSKLNSVVEEWKGTPYKYSGNSKSGIDCSHFVCFVLQEAYGFPSNYYFPSRELANQGEIVRKDDLSEGDLVCFSINKNSKISHVGIYLGNGKFAHASTSKGVIISSLDEPYYRERFTTIRRVIDTRQYSSSYNP